MIVTRQRKKKRNLLPILLPIAAILMLVVAVSWPPSRNIIFNGPLKPVAGVLLGGWEFVSRPLTFSYQQQEITDRNTEIKQLNDKLADQKQADASKDAQIKQLQKQMAAAAAEANAAETPAPNQTPGAVVAAAARSNGLGAAAAADDPIHRTAQQWASMDPDNAAAVVQTLSPNFVAGVFAQMSPDTVGPIMDALPPKAAAAIVKAGTGTPAQVSAPTGR